MTKWLTKEQREEAIEPKKDSALIILFKTVISFPIGMLMCAGVAYLLGILFFGLSWFAVVSLLEGEPWYIKLGYIAGTTLAAIILGGIGCGIKTVIFREGEEFYGYGITSFFLYLLAFLIFCD